MRSRGLLIGALVGCVLLLAACACLVIGAGAGLFYARRAGWLNSPTPRATRDASATARPAPTPNPAELATMDSIQSWVIQQRGLKPTNGPVNRQFLSQDQVYDRQLKELQKSETPEEARDTVRLWHALGLIQSGFDLYQLELRLYTEGVAGFYDPDTGDLVVVSENGQLNAYEKTTFAHEYNHALQDQNYHIRAMGFSDAEAKIDSEKTAAVQALLEGDSTVLEEQYRATLSAADSREYDRVVQGLDVSVYNSVPDFLLRDFFFPYEQGRDFVQHYYDLGGWARVDEVWQHPPTSTKQILHPDRYDAGDNPLPVPRPALTDTLGSGWHLMEQNTMGEWYTYLILAHGENTDARLSDKTAQAAAAGWGGDAYAAFYNDSLQQTLLALHWQWDSQSDADQFNRAFQDYAGKRFRAVTRTAPGVTCWSGEALNCVYVRGVHTLWLAGPDQATLDRVLTQYPDLQP